MALDKSIRTMDVGLFREGCVVTLEFTCPNRREAADLEEDIYEGLKGGFWSFSGERSVIIRDVGLAEDVQ